MGARAWLGLLQEGGQVNTCCGCNKEFEEELTKVRIDYPDGEDWEAFELCNDCMLQVVIPRPET